MLLLSTVVGCASLRWYGQAVGGQLDLLSRREHIAELLADPTTDPLLASQLTQVLAIRQFAVAELALPTSRSYRHYADLERSAAVWNVIAAPRYSVAPVTWCYPIAGCVAYRGYFDQQDAIVEARKLSDEGLDTIVSPAIAYSTLGWFDDPVLNTMLAWSETELAAFLFHELAHEAVYVAGDTAFNEAYASVVERVGVERWLRATSEDNSEKDELEAWRQRQEIRTDWTQLMLTARADLQQGYAATTDQQALAIFKVERFGQLQHELAALADQHLAPGLRRWSEQSLNNANLALIATYGLGVEAFDAVLLRCQQNMACFHAEVRELARASSQVRSDFLAQNDTQ